MKTFCPECGIDVAVDEDGLCISCGATAVGQGVEQLAIRLYALRVNQEQITKEIRGATKGVQALRTENEQLQTELDDQEIQVERYFNNWMCGLDKINDLQAENEQLQKEIDLAISLVHHIRGLPTAKLDGKAYEMAHAILRMRDNKESREAGRDQDD